MVTRIRAAISDREFIDLIRDSSDKGRPLASLGRSYNGSRGSMQRLDGPRAGLSVRLQARNRSTNRWLVERMQESGIIRTRLPVSPILIIQRTACARKRIRERALTSIHPAVIIEAARPAGAHPVLCISIRTYFSIEIERTLCRNDDSVLKCATIHTRVLMSVDSLFKQLASIAFREADVLVSRGIVSPGTRHQLTLFKEEPRKELVINTSGGRHRYRTTLISARGKNFNV